MTKTAYFRYMISATAAMIVLGTASAKAHETADYERLIEEKAPAIVTVKFVLKIKSQWGEHESENEVSGAIVSENGLVICANSHFGGGAWLARSGATAVPSDIKILIGDDTEGIEASFIARDTDLDLAWLKLDKQPDKKLAFIDLSKAATPKLGDQLYLVNRLAKYFDRAPIVMNTQMGGTATKPRQLYIPTGGSGAMGLPIFDSHGKVVGLSIAQMPGEEEMEASGGMAGGSVMILPAEKAQKATKRALATASEEEEDADDSEEGEGENEE